MIWLFQNGLLLGLLAAFFLPFSSHLRLPFQAVLEDLTRRAEARPAALSASAQFDAARKDGLVLNAAQVFQELFNLS